MVKSNVVQFHTTGISLIKGPLTRALKKWIHQRNSGSLMCGEQYCEGGNRTSITKHKKGFRRDRSEMCIFLLSMYQRYRTICLIGLKKSLSISIKFKNPR